MGAEAPPADRVATVAFLVLLVLYGAVLFGRAGRPLETDELKYIVLARKLTLAPSSYTLRDTLLLPRLASDVNDVPLFYHPPLVPILLRGWYDLALRRPGDVAFVENARGERGGPALAAERELAFQRFRAQVPQRGYSFVPIASHLATLALLWFYWGRGPSRKLRAWPVLLMALSPATGTIATQVWIDSVLTLLMLATLTLHHRAVRRGRWWDFSLAGAALGFALLTKFTAFLLVPVLAVHHLLTVGWDRAAWRRLAATLVPAALIAAPWFALFFATYGELLPSWIQPSAEMQRKFPFVAMVVNRSPLYYPVAVALFMPACLFALGAFRRQLRDADTPLLAGFVVVVLAAFTWLGLTGGGYQTRHVLPALPALCLIAGRVIARSPAWVPGVAALLLVWSTWNLHANLAREDFERAAEVELFVPASGRGIVLR